MIYEIVNPSDAVTIEADDVKVAGLATWLLSNGYGLDDEEGQNVWPIAIFGIGQGLLETQGIPDVDKFIKDNALRMAEVLDSVMYGYPSDRALVKSAMEKMTPENAATYLSEWNEKHRSSMNNIGKACRTIAKRLRELHAENQLTEAAK